MVCHYTAATSAPRGQMAWFESTHRHAAPIYGATEQHLLHLVQLPLKSRKSAPEGYKSRLTHKSDEGMGALNVAR